MTPLTRVRESSTLASSTTELSPKTSEQALEVAKINRAAHQAADIANLFKGGPAFDAQAEFGYRHGWYMVADYSFCLEDITGEKYDITQGGWAYL